MAALFVFGVLLHKTPLKFLGYIFPHHGKIRTAFKNHYLLSLFIRIEIPFYLLSQFSDIICGIHIQNYAVCLPYALAQSIPYRTLP